MKPVRRRERQRGVALLMVLVALTILGAMTANLMEANRVYLATAVNARDAVRAEYMARSGVNLSRLILSFQRLLGKAANFPFWQYTDLIVSMFVSSEDGGMLADLAGLDLSGVEGIGLGVEDGDLSVTVVDEDSKINVNMSNDLGSGSRRRRMIDQLVALTAPPEYDTIFELAEETEEFSTREEIICEVVDYSDADEEICDKSGGEDRSIYQSFDPPYERKNAPFDSLEELHLINGINDDFWAAFIEPNPEEPDKRVMSVWGKGRVNVNTAPTQVLLPLVCSLAPVSDGVSPCSDPTQLLNLMQILQGIVIMRSFMPFNSVKDFTAAIRSPERLFLPIPGFPIRSKGAVRYAFTTSSTVFSIYAEGMVGKVTKRIHTVVDMKSEDMLNPAESITAAGGKVLYWRME